ncbi:MAG: flavodoxin [Oscillospiraceae bacterium]|jgi:flavorubredoxin|nr:flavodoxin [Oscillospiraceae bacterium]
MNSVIYATKTGNTKKLALAVAKGAGTAAQSVEEAGAISGVDTLFVGASVYAGKIDEKLRGFLVNLTPNTVRRVVVFGSAMGKRSALTEIRSLLTANGVAVYDKEFFCKGQFLLFNRNCPDAGDLANAEAFAREMVGGR